MRPVQFQRQAPAGYSGLSSNTDVKLTTAIDPLTARLKTQLDAIRAQYEHVIINCPPALSWLTINAFTASDRVLIPLWTRLRS